MDAYIHREILHIIINSAHFTLDLFFHENVESMQRVQNSLLTNSAPTATWPVSSWTD